jgi:hypothetical protein
MDVGFAARVLKNEETVKAKNEIKLPRKGNGLKLNYLSSIRTTWEIDLRNS